MLGRPLRRLAERALARRADRLDHAASRPLRAGRSGAAYALRTERPTSGVGPDGGLENEPRKNAGAPGDWHPKLKSEPVPGVLLPCSLTVLSCEARGRREMTRATSSGVQGEGGGEISTP